MNKKCIALTLLVFIFAICVRCYWFSQKTSFHADEGFAIQISHNNKEISKTLPEKSYLAKDLKSKIFFTSNSAIHSVLKDVKELRYGSFDKLNTTFYYSLFRTAQLNQDSQNLMQYIQRGFYLNLLIFSLSFFVMFKLLNLFDFNKNYIPFILLVCFLNTGSISNTLLIKSYILQEFAYILLAYVFAYNIKLLKNNSNILNIKNVLLLPLGICISLFSGYFSLFYLAMLFIAYTVYAIKKKSYKNIGIIFGFGIISLLITFLIYPSFFSIFSVDNPTTSNSYNYFGYSPITMIKDIFYITCKYLFYIPVLFILAYSIFYIIKNKIRLTNSLILILVGINIFVAILSLYFGIYKVLRYVVPTFAIISLILPFLLFELNKKIRNILVSITIIIYIFSSIFAKTIESPDSAIISKENKYFPNIENTFINTQCEPIKNAEVPILVLTKEDWQIYNILPYMKDNQIVILNHYNKKIKALDHFIVLIGDNEVASPKDYKLLSQFNCQRFEGYELKKIKE